MTDFTYRFEREVRGVPRWLLKDYLRKLGGREVGGGVFRGEGWMVEVREMAPARVGHLTLGRVWMVVCTKDKGTFDAFYPRLELMLWRGGG